MSKGPTYNDIMTAPAKDLMRVYKLDERKLEQGVRKHLHGASQTEMRSLYGKIYDNKGKR